jgi:hypothetical protein
MRTRELLQGIAIGAYYKDVVAASTAQGISQGNRTEFPLFTAGTRVHCTLVNFIGLEGGHYTSNDELSESGEPNDEELGILSTAVWNHGPVMIQMQVKV